MAQATDVVWQPKGDATTHKEGTIVAQATSAGWGSANYVINTYVSNLPTTGDIFDKYDARYTGCAPCL